MGKKIKMRYPIYLKDFKCIGGECEDTCCVGWDVDIDKITFKQYYKVQDKEMKKLFQKNAYNNEYYYSEDVDYGKMKLKKGKVCPFLDENKYCIIYSKLGEEYLSNVCTSFPRITNKINGYYEMSLDVACPEAARILLLRKEGIGFKESEETLGKHILSSCIDTNYKEFRDSPVRYLKEIRDFSIKIIKSREFDLSERLFILGDFLEKLEEKFSCNYKEIIKFINGYKISLSDNSYKKDEKNYTFEVSFFKKMIDDLNVFKEVDSNFFKEYTKEIIEGFNISKENTISTYSERYKKGFNLYYKEFIENNSYIFENYLVNFIYKNLFPFSETESVFDGYIMLLIRYSFIRFYLIGIFLFNKETYSPDSVARFIQVFSKTIEHHKTYLVDVLEYVKENNLDNMEFGKKIL
ncbi:flagellin lysine-N-methylase [Clostridium weizhouense]|uniref:Flagellin lysine-N-methylase n=1 Tax=Clostridium weizhouense TaxID=2859781 RepID=A0ABS7APT5_9CLOT|nr:flagellin lysine-N-methylase [Clostridium weizhouense]MBW6410676.1 flagellin lysine-N-methylase [Clostridium weizhouense]